MERSLWNSLRALWDVYTIQVQTPPTFQLAKVKSAICTKYLRKTLSCFFLFFPGLHLPKLKWNSNVMAKHQPTDCFFKRIFVLLHSFHHIHNLHITVAPFSRQDLFSRVTWCMKINFAFSNTPIWSPSPLPSGMDTRACCRKVKNPNQYGPVILWCLFMYRIDPWL